MFNSPFPHTADNDDSAPLNQETVFTQRRLGDFISDIPEVFWVLSPDLTHAMYVSPSFEAMWGLPRTQFLAEPHCRFDVIHPADRQRVIDAVTQKIRLGLYDEEYRIILNNGVERHIRDRAFVMRDANQNVLRIVGISSDISRHKLSQKKIQQSRIRFEKITQHSADIILMTDQKGIVTYASEANSRVLGWTTEQVVGHPLLQFAHPDDLSRMQSQVHALLDTPGMRIETQFQMRNAHGEYVWMEGTSSNLFDVPEVNALVINCRDISARKRAEEALEAMNAALEGKVTERTQTLHEALAELKFHNKRQEAVLEALPDALILCNIDGDCLSVNGSSHTLLKSKNRLVNRNIREFGLPSQVTEKALQTIAKASETRRLQVFEYHVDWGKERRYFEARIKATNSSRKAQEIVILLRDVTANQENLHRVERMATQDGLTKLLNRKAIIERLIDEIEYAQQSERRIAVLYFDLDGFKPINDDLGHDAGDLLLQTIASRIKALSDDRRFVGRVGGDEFVVVMSVPQDSAISGLAAELAQRVIQLVSEPVHVRGRSIKVSASVGIATYPRDGLEAEQLIKHADAAMYQAKALGKKTFVFFNQNARSVTLDRLNVDKEFRKLVENNRLKLAYQPQIDAKSGRVAAMEALLRTDSYGMSDTGIFFTPGRFIPLAEQSGVIHEVGHWVLHETCRHMAAQRDAKHGKESKLVPIAINVSPYQLHKEDFVADIAATLKQYKIPPDMLILEITESSSIPDLELAEDMFHALGRLGVKIALDDFGMGPSSFVYLRNLPIHQIKIDKSFVASCDSNDRDGAIASGLITIAHNLNIKVVAEGVENHAQAHFLRKVGCDLLQGYFFSQPLREDQLGQAFNENYLDLLKH